MQVAYFQMRTCNRLNLIFNHIFSEKLILLGGELWRLMVLYSPQVPLRSTPVWLLFIPCVRDKDNLSFDSGKAHVLAWSPMQVLDPPLPSPTPPLFCAHSVSYGNSKTDQRCGSNQYPQVPGPGGCQIIHTSY